MFNCAENRFPGSMNCCGGKSHPDADLISIFAEVHYKLHGKLRKKGFGLNIPASMEMGTRITTMSSFARRVLIPPAAQSGTLVFRLDWSYKPLTAWKEVQDWIYHQTQCGTQHTVRHWIPVNTPQPPTPPPPPVNRRTVRGSAGS